MTSNLKDPELRPLREALTHYRSAYQAACERLHARHPSVARLCGPQIWEMGQSQPVDHALVYCLGLDDWTREGLGVQLNDPSYELIAAIDLDVLLQSYNPAAASCLIIDLPALQATESSWQLAHEKTACPTVMLADQMDASSVAEAFRLGIFDVLLGTYTLETLGERVALAASKDQNRIGQSRRAHMVQSRFDSLSDREQEVMLLLGQGLSIKQISSCCEIGFQTVAKHRTRVLKKMGVSSDVELALLLRDFTSS